MSHKLFDKNFNISLLKEVALMLIKPEYIAMCAGIKQGINARMSLL